MTLLIYLFFFKQKTAYEMRISDWSSDVCSSDLYGTRPVSADALIDCESRSDCQPSVVLKISATSPSLIRSTMCGRPCWTLLTVSTDSRSEERSVGKECVSTCRFRL